jgi:hypothetical protein
MNQYDVAQICINGHLITSTVTTSPQRAKDFCDRCGGRTISRCEECTAPIRGAYCYYRFGRLVTDSITRIPAFCQKCGKAYPWTESKLDAARDLADQLGLDIPERTLLEKSIEEIIRDTPRAAAEAIKFKIIVEKTQPWALPAFKEILIGVVSESVKKLIWPA